MGKSVSVIMGKGSLNHNNRVFTTKNVDPSLTSQNVILRHQNLKDAYQDAFGKALEKYNAKQKRKDRRIIDYLEHIQKSKNGEKPFYEIVAQIGDRYNTGIKSADAEIAKQILHEYYFDFVTRNPHMKVFNAVIHMDEFDGTPHLHLDFIPVATGQKQGLETKNSMRKALEQQGFAYQKVPSRDPNISPSYAAVSKIGGGRWLDVERAALALTMNMHGIEREKKGIHRSNLSVAEYKACAEIVDNILDKTAPAEIAAREPTRAMKIAGVHENEIIVQRDSIEEVQHENVVLRVQVEQHKQALSRIDYEKNPFLSVTINGSQTKYVQVY